jgi:hypothetical protein
MCMGEMAMHQEEARHQGIEPVFMTPIQVSIMPAKACMNPGGGLNRKLLTLQQLQLLLSGIPVHVCGRIWPA